MPYIKQHRRLALINKDDYPRTIGEMNWKITSDILQWICEQGESYRTYNEVIGLLECIKLEMYRKRIAKYEDKKEKKNGKVY